MKTYRDIFLQVAQETVAWWLVLFPSFLVMLPFLALNGMFATTDSVKDETLIDLGICLVFSLPAVRLLFLLWKHRPTASPCFIAGAVILFLFFLPGLRWLGDSELRDFKARPHSHIVKTVESPESLFIQDDNDIMRIIRYKRWWSSEEYHRYATRTFLDGTRVKTLALNEAGGAVRLYRSLDVPIAVAIEACRETLASTRKERDALYDEAEAAREQGGDATAIDKRRLELTEALFDKKERCEQLEKWHAEAPETFASAEAFLAASPPRYRAHIQKKERRFLDRMPLYSIQRMDIYDNETGERIAWAENLQKYNGWFGPWRLALGPGEHYFLSFLERVFPGPSKQKRNKADRRQTPPPAP